MESEDSKKSNEFTENRIEIGEVSQRTPRQCQLEEQIGNKIERQNETHDKTMKRNY